MSNKPFSETKIGAFLKDKAPNILSVVGDLLPEKGALGIIKNMIGSDPKLTAEERAEGLKLLQAHELDILKETNRSDEVASKEVTDRHKTDMLSDSRLSKAIRPAMLIGLSCAVTVLCFLDSITSLAFEVDSDWKEIFKWAWMAALSFYFVGREVTKWGKVTKK